MSGSLDARLRRVSQAIDLVVPARYRVVWTEEFLGPLPEYRERKAEIERLNGEYQGWLGDPRESFPPEKRPEAERRRQALLSAMESLCRWEAEKLAGVDGASLGLAWDEVLIKVVFSFPGGSVNGR